MREKEREKQKPRIIFFNHLKEVKPLQIKPRKGPNIYGRLTN